MAEEEKPKKKKHNWMKGFVIPPRASEAQIYRNDVIERSKALKHRYIKYSCR